VQAAFDEAHTLFSPQKDDETSAESGKKKLGKTLRTGLQVVGANNVPILTPVLNKLYLYSIYESLEPGWLERHKAGLKSRGQVEF